MGNRDEKEKPKDRQAAAAIAVDKHETDQPVTMVVVRELLQAQESRLKSQFESVVQSLEKRVHDVEKSVKEIKTRLEYTQKDVDELKPLQSKIVMANEEINKLNTDLSSKSLSMEYLENQSRRNNIRVNGIPEPPRETWKETGKKVIQTVRNKLGVDIDIKRAFNGLILFGSLFVFVHTLESSKTMNLTITNNAPKHALFHGGHDRPCSLLQLMRGRPSMSRDRKQ